MINFFPLWWKQPLPPAHLLLDALVAITVSGIPIFLIIRQLLHHLIPRKRQVPVQKLGAVLPWAYPCPRVYEEGVEVEVEDLPTEFVFWCGCPGLVGDS